MFSDSQRPSPFTALVVHESDFHRQIAADLLRAAGAERVFTAENGRDGLDLLADQRPRLAVLDWAIGGMDALEFARRVRFGESRADRAAPMIMLTDRCVRADVERARKAGINTYVVKPTSAAKLGGHIRSVLTSSRPFIVSQAYVGPCRRRGVADPSYVGPMRRLSDTPDAGRAEETPRDPNAARILDSVEALAAAISAPIEGNADYARHVFRAICSVRQLSESLAEPIVAAAAGDVQRYIEAFGATRALPRDHLRVCGEALHRLALASNEAPQVRAEIAANLKRMVDKKLAQSIAA